MTFSFNSKQDPGSRILENTVTINNKPLDRKKVCVIVYFQFITFKL